MLHQRGNILFLILLAVVLFAALSYAVTQGMRGGGNDASNESGQASAAELLNYFAQMDAAVQRMMLTGGVKDYELSFYYLNGNNYVAGGDNTNCTESRCRVFDPNGGGVAGRQLDALTRIGINDGERLTYESIPGAGTDKPDIVFRLAGVKPSICLDINKRIGINDHIYNVANIDSTPAAAVYSYGVPVGPIPDTTATLTGVPLNAGIAGTFCFCIYANKTACETSSNYRPVVAHVILAR